MTLDYTKAGVDAVLLGKADLVSPPLINPLINGLSFGAAVAAATDSSPVALGNVAGLVTCDLSVGNMFTGILTGDVEVQFTNWPASAHVTLQFTQDAIGGRVFFVDGVTWFPVDVPPVFPSDPGRVISLEVLSADAGVTVAGYSMLLAGSGMDNYATGDQAGGGGGNGLGSVVLTGTPVAGWVPTATSPTAAAWAAPALGAATPDVANIGNLGTGVTVNLASTTGRLVRINVNSTNGTIAFSGILPGARWTAELTQDSVGGKTVAGWTGITWVTGGPPVLATGPYGLDVFEFYCSSAGVIYGFHITPHPTSTGVPYMSPGHLEVFPRILAQTTLVMASGTVYLTHFIPDYDFLFSQLTCAVTTAGSGITFGKMGIYRYLGSNNYSCIARSTQNTTPFQSSGAAPLAVTDDGAATPNSIFNAVARGGVEYAFAELVIGTGMPRLAMANVPPSLSFASENLRLCTSLAGQTDLTPSLTANASVASVVWGGMTP